MLHELLGVAFDLGIWPEDLLDRPLSWVKLCIAYRRIRRDRGNS